MIGILVTGHGNFATGISSSVKLIAGMPEKYEMVDFLVHIAPDEKYSHSSAIFYLPPCVIGAFLALQSDYRCFFLNRQDFFVPQ